MPGNRQRMYTTPWKWKGRFSLVVVVLAVLSPFSCPGSSFVDCERYSLYGDLILDTCLLGEGEVIKSSSHETACQNTT